MNARLQLAAWILMIACASARETPAPAAAPVTETQSPGQRLYARHCLSCHQSDGGGVPNMQPPIVDGTWVKGDPQALALFVLTGGFDSADRKDSAAHNPMPPFAQLSDEDLAAILTYIRAKFGGGGSAVNAGQVAAARATIK